MPRPPRDLTPLLDILYQHSGRRLREVKAKSLKFAHYTSAENALNIVSGRSVWLRNASVMNDHSEIEHGRRIVSAVLDDELGRKFCRALDRVHDGISNAIRGDFYQDAHDAREVTYLTSMCEHEADDWLGRLSMWRAYGGPSAGVALVFKPEVVTDPSLNLGLFPSPVLYGDAADFARELTKVIDGLEAQPQAIEAVDAGTVSLVVGGLLHFAMLSLKHAGFAEEREWRIICPLRQLPPDSPVRRRVVSIGGIPQEIVELPFDGHEGIFLPQLRWSNMLDRIIIGPSSHPEVVKRALEAALRAQNVSLWDQLIEVSEIPLRSRD